MRRLEFTLELLDHLNHLMVNSRTKHRNEHHYMIVFLLLYFLFLASMILEIQLIIDLH